MANAGDTYCIELKESHLDWGNYRKTITRKRIDEEGYIPIAYDAAKRLSIYNSNYSGDKLGYNLFYCSSAEGLLNHVLIRAAGSKEKGDIYAKQFQGNGNLKVFGKWFRHHAAVPGDIVQVTWKSPNEIFVELLKKH